MALSFPVDCLTPEDRTLYLYRAQELLRVFFNNVGLWHTQGLTQQQFDDDIVGFLNDLGATGVRDTLAGMYTFSVGVKLTDAEWSDFITDVYDPIANRVFYAITIQRALLKASTTWTVNLDDLDDA
jgi:hypothetical protein